jgi:hypothetical protein
VEAEQPQDSGVRQKYCYDASTSKSPSICSPLTISIGSVHAWVVVVGSGDYLGED